MSRKTFTAGSVLTAADVNTYCSHEGNAWTTWTPTVTQSGAVAVTVNEATVAKDGRRVTFTAKMTVTGSGTSSNVIVITLPEATKTYLTDSIIGAATLRMVSGTIIAGTLAWVSTTTVKIMANGGTDYIALAGSGTTAALAAGHTIMITGCYEAAS